MTEKEYIDDWYCRHCEHGPLSEADTECPECGTKWNENEPREDDE